MIPYGHQTIDDDDIEAVVEVLRSEWLTQGPVNTRFEKCIANYCDARFAISFNSATSALHIACKSLGLAHGDVLWTSPNTFVASANAALYCGASIDFIDIEPQTYNISINALAKKLEIAKSKGQLPKIVIPVHFAGQSCDMQAIGDLSKEYGFHVIEDASHAIGGKYQDKPIGSCIHSDITIFSFHPVKIITTGEGGVAVTQNENIANKINLLKNHGITRNVQELNNKKEGPWYYEQIALGFNYRMTEMQAALGVSQMKRLDEFVMRRSELANRYNTLLSDLPINLPMVKSECKSTWHLYVICLELEKTAKSRMEIFNNLRQAGIGVNVHYIPVHTQPYYRQFGFKPGDFPISENYYEMALTLPLFPKLTEKQQDYIVNKLTEQFE